MMWFRSFCAVLFVLISPLVYSQFSIGFDVEVNRDFWELSDSHSELKKSPRINGSPGICYRYEFPKKWVVMSGIRFKYYSGGVSFKRIQGTFTSTGGPALQVPLLLGKNINLYKEKLFLCPLLGGVFNALLVNDTGTSRGYIGHGSDSIRFSAATRNSRSTFIALRLGLSLEYKVSKRFSAAVFFQYTKGFSVVSKEYIRYHTNVTPETEAVQTNYGTYGTYLGLRLFFHFAKKE